MMPGGLLLPYWGGAAGGHGYPPAPKITSQPPLPKAAQLHKEFHLFHSFLFPPEEKWRAFIEIITFLTAY